MSVNYTYVVEELSADGDIVDVSHEETFADAVSTAKLADPSRVAEVRVGLVRDEFNRSGEHVDRVWAYVHEGRLPHAFVNSRGNPVPGLLVSLRFHLEVARIPFQIPVNDSPFDSAPGAGL